jgi:hypothetical protein
MYVLYVRLYFVCEPLTLWKTSMRRGPCREEALAFGHVALALIRRCQEQRGSTIKTNAYCPPIVPTFTG